MSNILIMRGNGSDEEEQISEPFEDCGEKPSVDRLPAPSISEASKSHGFRSTPSIKNPSIIKQDIVSEPTEDYEEGPITNRLLSNISGTSPASRSSRISVAAMEREKKVAAAGIRDGSYRLQRLKPPERMASDLTRPRKKDATKMKGKLSSMRENEYCHTHLLQNQNEKSLSDCRSNITLPGNSTLSTNNNSSPPPTTATSKMSITEIEREKKVAAGGYKVGRMERRKPPETILSDLTRPKKKDTSNMEGSSVYGAFSPDESSRSSCIPSNKSLPAPPPTATTSSRLSVADMERERKVAATGFKDGAYRLHRLKPPEKMGSDLTRRKNKDTTNMEGKLSLLGENQHYHEHLLDNRNETSQFNNTQRSNSAPYSNKRFSPPPTNGSTRMSVSDIEREKKVAAAGFQEGSYSLKRLKPPDRMASNLKPQNTKDTSNMEGSLSSLGEDSVYRANSLDNPKTEPARMSVADMEVEKKVAAVGIAGVSFRQERRKPPERMASDLPRQNKKDTSNMEGSLSSFGEDLIYQAHLHNNQNEHSWSSGTSSRVVTSMGVFATGIKSNEITMSDLAQEPKTIASGLEESLSSLGEKAYQSSRIPVADMEREKKIAAAASKGSLMIRREIPVMASEIAGSAGYEAGFSSLPGERGRGVLLTGAELEQEKKIASAGVQECSTYIERRQAPAMMAASGYNTSSFPRMNREKGLAEPEEKSTIQPDRMSMLQNSCNSFDSRLSTKLRREGGERCSIDSQILTDQMGRAIDLDNEFAFLHSNIEGMHGSCGDIVQDENALPGAIAVFGIDYDHDDMDTDYVNPDNFEIPEARRGSATSQVSPPAPMVEENSRQQDETIVAEKCTIKKKIRLLILATLVIIGVIIAVVVALLIGGDDASESLPPTTSLPSVPVLVPTPEPMRPPTPSPSIISINESFTIQDSALGSSLGIAEDFLVVSNSSTIRTYKLRDSLERRVVPTEQVINGSDVCLSRTNRIAVVNGYIVRAYDYVDRSWKQVGGDIKSSNPIQVVSISGDGSCIATSTLTGDKLQSQIYKFSGTWKHYVNDIDYLGVSWVTNALNHDGTLFSFGFKSSYSQSGEGGNDLYLAPKYIDERWTRVSAPTMSSAYVVAFSRDGKTLVTGGFGTIVAMAIDSEKYPNVYTGVIGGRIRYDLDWTPWKKKVVLAVADDGTRIAFSAENDNVQVFELQNDQWVSSLMLPQMKFGVDALSFSSDGKLAVGIRDTGSVHIFELGMPSDSLSSVPQDQPVLVPATSPPTSLPVGPSDPPSFSPPSSQPNSPTLKPLGELSLTPSILPSISLPYESSAPSSLSPSKLQSITSFLEQSNLPSLAPSTPPSSSRSLKPFDSISRPLSSKPSGLPPYA